VARYSLAHKAHAEWVCNDGDIDAAEVVWARETDAQSDRRVAAYFQRVRLADVNAGPPGISDSFTAEPWLSP
jgi:hypothetical protein